MVPMRRQAFTPIRAAIGVIVWLGFSVGALASFNLDLPPATERLLSALAFPGIIAITLWNPLLRPFGLTRGEWFVLPSPLGCLLIIIIYTILAYALVRLGWWIWRRSG
jgi:hypothetical protein